MESPIKIYRTLNEAQHKRVNIDHQATVKIGDDGNLQFFSEEIITPKGLVKQNKRISIVPSTEETVVSIDSAAYLFSELAHMNIILTNACNLKCSYCYEQHNQDFGRFTEESLLKAYNFMLKYSNAKYRQFQFFGGEPLIHKDLILNFLKNNREYLSINARAKQRQVISMITNGILLTPTFIKEYFSYDFTWMLVSLDTLDATIDHRELDQVQIDKILESIASIPEEAKRRVWMRNTISKETAHGLEKYIDTIYNLGIKNIIIHPLILDSTVGFIPWNENEWNTLHKTLMNAIYKYNDLEISFSEGVGVKGENNCMIGSDMIAIDGSGDFSGCYFFTNQKGNGADTTILGNVFNDTIYIDRYKHFQKEFLKMFEEEEQCKTCDYKNKCYQCPAGNLDTGSKMFRPDDMCQKVVKLYLDLQNDVARKQYSVRFEQMKKLVNEQGEDQVFRETGFYLLYEMVARRHLNSSEDRVFPNIPAEELFAVWKTVFERTIKPGTTTFSEFVHSLPYDCSKKITVKELYEFLLDYLGLPSNKSRELTDLNLDARIGYFVLLEVLVMKNMYKDFQNAFSKKILEND